MADLEKDFDGNVNFSDEELVLSYRHGNVNALNELINRYHNFVRMKVSSYFLVGADSDDIMQEGMIGLYKAIKDFDESRIASFKTFAGVCITRQIITAVKTATRQKHIPLNSYISLSKKVYDEKTDRTLFDVISEDKISDPEAIVIDREEYDGFEYRLNKALSKLELKVLAFYLEGRSYQEISGLINKDVKSVDNALQRIKKKVEMLVSESDNRD